MKEKENNFAYIDGANLHKGVGELGWELDYNRFRVWLKERYGLYLSTQKSLLVKGIQKEKAPAGDRTPEGSSS